ncbi:PAS domain S-box-containing protein [Allochromatium warmingii]|uniref:PAS domain S-box-containing protein n=1 Tax=Allochromatium warmingii TaxID=61595 RepID=A0A1H3G0W4_ALLWA|nr:HD domain-containing phosphohydrolase [Allochromatium warmingii]SDX96876.1 PAS domain S-box-containing protein [Allochromatium warmingii]
MNKPIQFAIAALALSLGLALYGIIVFANAERERDLRALQTQMSLVAESRVAAIAQWLQGQYSVLEGLAYQEALHRAIGTATAAAAPPSDAHRETLRTLLAATSERLGVASLQATGYQPHRLEALASGALAVVDPTGQILAASGGLTALDARLSAFLQRTPLAERGLLDLYLDTHARPTLGVVVPVRAWLPNAETTSDATAAPVIARVLALRPLDAGVFAILKQPGITARTAETYLIRRADSQVEYLSPLLDGSEPLTKRLALTTEQLIDAAALAQPGQFHHGRHYAVQDSFAVSRRVPGSDWVLVHRVGAAEALAASDAHRMALISGLAVLTVLISAALVLVWFYASSRRVEEVAECYRLSSERFERLSGFLDILTDSQPNPILVVDAQQRIAYANRRLAELSGLSSADLLGRDLSEVLGTDIGERYQTRHQQVLTSGVPQIVLETIRDANGCERVWRSHHHPFTTASAVPEPAVLVTIEDLTDLMRERTRRERNTEHLIDTLVGLVDERDPDAAHQSRSVVQVACAIAADLGFDPQQLETVKQAARLVNIGKIRIPRSLLVKGSGLTDQELKRVREALESGPDLLREIEFDGPVLDVLAQINERIDGSGRPRGLMGEQIHPAAQVIALANAFIALISPRSFRDAKSCDEAIAILMREIGRRFEQRLVLSLINYLDHGGGREVWMMAREGVDDVSHSINLTECDTLLDPDTRIGCGRIAP